MNKPEQLRLAADIIEKNLPCEWRTKPERGWGPITGNLTTEVLSCIKYDYEFRLAPPPPAPSPLGMEDVPPGSFLKHKFGDKYTWAHVCRVAPDYVVTVHCNGSAKITWAELKGDYLIKRPGEDWQECSKLAK